MGQIKSSNAHLVIDYPDYTMATCQHWQVKAVIYVWQPKQIVLFWLQVA